MRVSFEIGDTKARLGNNGIVFYISDNNGSHVGKLRLGKAKVEWCRGRTRIGNGKKVTVERLIQAFENLR